MSFNSQRQNMKQKSFLCTLKSRDPKKVDHLLPFLSGFPNVGSSTFPTVKNGHPTCGSEEEQTLEIKLTLC